MELKATNGTINAFEDRVEISRKSVGGFITQGIKGDRIIYYKDMKAIEYKKPTMLANGYLQFITNVEMAKNQGVGILGSSLDATKDPNAVILRAFKKKFGEETENFYNYVMERFNYFKNAKDVPASSLSSADELRKFKALLDDGIITQDEFDAKKKELLGM